MRKAVALRYDRQKNRAPQVVASGQGRLAARMLALAQESNVPVYEDHELVDALRALPVGSEIPPEFYELVAQILAFVLRLDKEQSSNKGSNGNSQGEANAAGHSPHDF